MKEVIVNTCLRTNRKGPLVSTSCCGERSAQREQWKIRPWRGLGPNLGALNDELKRLDFILCFVGSQ